jgi:hypothetical protein
MKALSLMTGNTTERTRSLCSTLTRVSPNSPPAQRALVTCERTSYALSVLPACGLGSGLSVRPADVNGNRIRRNCVRGYLVWRNTASQAQVSRRGRKLTPFSVHWGVLRRKTRRKTCWEYLSLRIMARVEVWGKSNVSQHTSDERAALRMPLTPSREGS